MASIIFTIITWIITVHIVLSNPCIDNMHIVFIHIDHRNHSWIMISSDNVTITMQEYGDDLEAFILVYDIINEMIIDAIENNDNVVVIVYESW